MEEKQDKLDKIFQMQQGLNDFIVKSRGIEFSCEEWIQKLILATLSELSEVLDEVNYKWWKNAKPLDSDALKDELVDVLHFFVSMCLRAGMSADEMFERYLRKNAENYDRQLGKSSKSGYALNE